MMKKRMAVLFLCFTILITVIPVFPVIATKVTHDDINDTMGSEAVLNDAVANFEDADAIFIEDFVDYPAYSNQTIVSGAINNGNLVLAGGSTPASFTLNSPGIPKGGYALFQIKSDADPLVIFDNGSQRFSFEPYAEKYEISKRDIYYQWQILHNTDGSFSGYYMEEGEETWNCGFSNVLGSGSIQESISFQVGLQEDGISSGMLYLDRFEIYAPGIAGDVVLTDGAGGKILSSSAQAEHMDSISVVVKSDVKRDRTLIVGIYGRNMALADVFVEEIPACENATMVVCNAVRKIQNVKKIRAFLWDDFSGMVPITTTSFVKGNVSSWTDDWSVSGNVAVEDDMLVLNSAAGEEAYASLDTEIESQFDISWNMTVNSYSGQETVQISNGRYRIELSVTADGVTYNTTSKAVTLPWIIQTSEHTYRLFGTGDGALLYIDKYFVGKLSDLEMSSDDSGMKFQTADESRMRIDQVVFKPYLETNIPVQGFYDEFEENECGWTLEDVEFNTGITKQFWKVENGYLRVDDEHIALDYSTYCVSYGHKEITEIGDEFIVQTRMSFPSFGTRSYLILYIGGRCFSLDMREKFFSAKPLIDNSKKATIASDELFLSDSEYHIITIESYNQKKNVRVYLDGVLILDDETEAYTNHKDEIRLMADGGWYLPASMQIDYIKYIPKYYDFELTSPIDDAVYQEGEAVKLEATKNVDFFLNGLKVANGTSTTLTDLPGGSYLVVAKSETDSSEPIRFIVEKKASATLQVIQNDTTISASLDSISGFHSVASVVYLLDGRKVGVATSGSYGLTISDVTPENHILEAVCYDEDGIEVTRMTKEITGIISDSTVAYSNEISYQVSGSGTVDVKNGMHQLQLSHKSTGIRYLTDEGVKSYLGGGLGDFIVLTDGPIAEIYKNGQFILSYFMPKTTQIGTSITGAVVNQEMVAPTERKNYFGARNLNVQNAVYELADLPYNHNLDFVVNSSDEVHLVLNDGYYRNDVTIQDGKLSVWTADRNNSLPKLTQIATLAAEDVYYRIETSAGMSRLYADGRWIATFRNGNVGGRKGSLAVHVTAGDGLSYVGVNSNADLYFYKDLFDGSGEFDSVDYWATSDCAIEVNADSENMSISTLTENATAEINAYVGNATLSADVTVNDGTQGVWLYGNHCVTESFTKAGYNFITNQYEIVNLVNGVENVVASKAGIFPVETTVSMSLSVKELLDGRVVSLLINGKEMLSTSDVIASRGTMGIALSKGSVLIDNVNFRGDAKPLLDVRATPMADAPNALDMIETDEKTWLVTNSKGYFTTDGGKTWEDFIPSANAGLGPNGYGGISKNMVTLQSGEIVSIHRNMPWKDEYGQNKVTYQAYVSTDHGQGMTWFKPGNANFPGIGDEKDAIQGRDATVNRITQGPSGRIYYVSGEGNSEDYGDAIVWMSDDDGMHWFESNTKISALDLGFVIAEAVVIETTASTRLYFRTDKGQLCYFESYDRGTTWDLTPRMTPFISSMTCFGIEADPEDPDTIYIGWGYDNINVFARAQFPRNRWAVAKSADGGNTWEMLGTVHENNSADTQSMNMSINVSKDYVYINGASSDEYLSNDDSKLNRIIAFPKVKQRSSVRLEQAHLMSGNLIENTVVLSDEQEEMSMAINSSDGTVLLRNQLISAAASGEYISLAVAASFVGATSVEVLDDSVMLIVGGQKVSLGCCDVKEIEGENFINLISFAEKMGMILLDENGIKIVSLHDQWSQRQKKAMRYAVDLFSNQP